MLMFDMTYSRCFDLKSGLFYICFGISFVPETYEAATGSRSFEPRVPTHCWQDINATAEVQDLVAKLVELKNGAGELNCGHILWPVANVSVSIVGFGDPSKLVDA